MVRRQEAEARASLCRMLPSTKIPEGFWIQGPSAGVRVNMNHSCRAMTPKPHHLQHRARWYICGNYVADRFIQPFFDFSRYTLFRCSKVQHRYAPIKSPKLPKFRCCGMARRSGLGVCLPPSILGIDNSNNLVSDCDKSTITRLYQN